ncbi:hypothetical protein [Actinocrispum sp. NPDC049592]|uniref:hypothetical protein n=1 Tax=Actinocrispum sp. NPDC049592 TaxID=3154835 RepID=UPI0034362422
MSTEELIKDAFRRQAGRAPDHMRVLTRVLARTAKRRSRALLYSLIGAGVAVAVAVPIVLVRAPVALPVGPAPAVRTTSPAKPLPGEVMPFQLGYLPDRLVESEREVLADGSLRRTWDGPPGSPHLVFERSGPNVVHGSHTPVVVQISAGVEGFFTGDDTQAELVWAPDGRTPLYLMSRSLPGARDELVKLARSVRPDGVTVIPAPVRFGWLPEDAKGTAPQSVSGTADHWDVRVTSSGRRTVGVQITTRPPQMPGMGVVVRGKQGRIGPNPEAPNALVVEYDTGRWLIVSGLAPDELVRVAGTLEISDGLSFPWLGRR